jgi:hypothetical protein
MHDVAKQRDAAEIVDFALKRKPELIIHAGNLPATAEALRDLLAASGKFFDRGMPVRAVKPADGGAPSAIPLTRSNVVMETHRLCQPMKVKDGEYVPATLPDRVAQMYLEMSGEWDLPPLDGVSTAPLLSSDGSLRTADGYDPKTSMWCANVPAVRLPSQPSGADAERALLQIRQTFQSFPFGDSLRRWDDSLGVEIVDITQPPGHDESAFLVALLTAVCRPSLWLAPGILVTSPAVSGAGCGKGLIVRAICTIAFGIRPRAFTAGGDRTELDKRLAAELIEAQPVLFLDNANGFALRSDTLASVLTERPARVRLLGQTRMVPLNSTAFVAITGNGLTVTEDLARRFIRCELDARCEDPETRTFPPGFLEGVERRRAELLAAMLTIWRWGRQNASALTRGKPLGSFETWAEWCRDPVERIEALKANDPYRQRVADLFRVWHERHGSSPTTVNQLDEAVKKVADPHERGRQYTATYISKLVGTHAGGFVLTRQEPAGKWGPHTYALTKAEPTGRIGHRTHRTDSPKTLRVPLSPMGPMGPMPDANDGEVPAGTETEI